MYNLNIFLTVLSMIFQIIGKTSVVIGLMLGQWYFLKNRIVRGKGASKWLHFCFVILLSLAMWGILTYWHALPFVMNLILEGIMVTYVASLTVLKMISKHQSEVLKLREKWIFIVLIFAPTLIQGVMYLLI